MYGEPESQAMVVDELIEQLKLVRGSAPLSCRLRVVPADLVAVDTTEDLRLQLTERPLAEALTSELYAEIDCICWEGGEVIVRMEVAK